MDVAGKPMQMVFSTANGERRIEASNMGRIYLARPDNAGGSAVTLPARRRTAANRQRAWQRAVGGLRLQRPGRVRLFTSRARAIQFSQNPEHKASPAGSVTGVMEPRAPVPSVLAGALIGRIGSGRAFAIGDQTAIAMPQSGRLMLGGNDGNVRDNSGVFVVTLSR